MLLGILIIIIGVIFLLENLGLITQPPFSVIWPIFLIVIGLYIIVPKSKK